jgi:hypothetical protein
MKRIFLSLMTAVAVFAAEKEPTAFELIKEGNRYVGEQAKDKVVEVRSEKSVGSLTPRVWYVLYHDRTATFKGVEVKFAGGKMVDVKRPFRLIERMSDTKELDWDKLKIDSDEAIKKALAEPILKDVTIKAVEAKLEDESVGPVWKVRLWAAKLNKSTETADIGKIFLAADDGKAVEIDIHLGRLD